MSSSLSKQKPQIGVVDYGMGNLHSVTNALEWLGGCSWFITSNPNDFDRADAYILPGVGAFKQAMNNLKKYDVIEELYFQVFEKNKPILGICLGMQLFAEISSEGGVHQGLGWIDGCVTQLEVINGSRVPHVGWANTKNKNDDLFVSIEQDACFYFDHSFHLNCDEKIVTSYCENGQAIVSSIRSNNIFATQFHPEKSQRNGLKLIRNYLNFCKDSLKINKYICQKKE